LNANPKKGEAHHCCSTVSENMNSVLRGVTVARMDAGAEPTGRYLRWVTELSTEFMSLTELARSKATVAIRLNIEVD